MPQSALRKVTLDKLRWIDIPEPTEKVLDKLKDEHGFHELDIEDCLSENQRAKIDDYQNYLFIVLHIPYYDKRHQRVVSEEVDIFVKNNVLITVHAGHLKPLNRLFESVQKSRSTKKEVMGHGAGFLLYEIIDHLYSSGFPILDTMEKNVATLEKDVFTLHTERDLLTDILTLKKNVITFRRVIAPQRPVIAQLEHKNQKFMPESLEIYFDDVVDKVEKIWSTLENLRELVEVLHQTNETIISHTTNNVIKILTIFSVVMLPLTFLTGLYGMNVTLPLAESGNVFFVITGVMVSVVLLMLAFFKFKRWI